MHSHDCLFDYACHINFSCSLFTSISLERFVASDYYLRVLSKPLFQGLACMRVVWLWTTGIDSLVCFYLLVIFSHDVGFCVSKSNKLWNSLCHANKSIVARRLCRGFLAMLLFQFLPASQEWYYKSYMYMTM